MKSRLFAAVAAEAQEQPEKKDLEANLPPEQTEKEIKIPEEGSTKPDGDAAPTNVVPEPITLPVVDEQIPEGQDQPEPTAAPEATPEPTPEPTPAPTDAPVVLEVEPPPEQEVQDLDADPAPVAAEAPSEGDGDLPLADSGDDVPVDAELQAGETAQAEQQYTDQVIEGDAMGNAAADLQRVIITLENFEALVEGEVDPETRVIIDSTLAGIESDYEMATSPVPATESIDNWKRRTLVSIETMKGKASGAHQAAIESLRGRIAEAFGSLSLSVADTLKKLNAVTEPTGDAAQESIDVEVKSFPHLFDMSGGRMSFAQAVATSLELTQPVVKIVSELLAQRPSDAVTANQVQAAFSKHYKLGKVTKPQIGDLFRVEFTQGIGPVALFGEVVDDGAGFLLNVNKQSRTVMVGGKNTITRKQWFDFIQLARKSAVKLLEDLAAAKTAQNTALNDDNQYVAEDVIEQLIVLQVTTLARHQLAAYRELLALVNK